MPYLLNLCSRQISQITRLENPHNWLSIRTDAMKLINYHQDIEWEYFPAVGLFDAENSLLIFQTRDEAFDVEYWTRESEFFWGYGPPCPVTF